MQGNTSPGTNFGGFFLRSKAGTPSEKMAAFESPRRDRSTDASLVVCTVSPLSRKSPFEFRRRGRAVLGAIYRVFYCLYRLRRCCCHFDEPFPPDFLMVGFTDRLSSRHNTHVNMPRVETSNPPHTHTRATGVVSRSVYMVRHSQGSYMVCPLLSLEVATPENNNFFLSCHPYARKNAKSAEVYLASGFLVNCSSPLLRLAEHLTALRARCTRCLPGRCNLDLLRPGIVWMRGSMVIRLRL